MVRNIRRKAALAKSKRRRDSDVSSSLDLSSDGGYSALEEVSDSEDNDEEDVYAAEEKHIIQGVTKARHAPSPRPPDQNEEEDADEEEADGAASDDDDDDDDDELEELDDADFAELANEMDTSSGHRDGTLALKAKFVDDGASWNGVSESDANQAGGRATPAKRQVRFAGVPDSDSDSTTSDVSLRDSQYFPDIFVEQGSLDPGFRREIEHDSDSSVSSSFWDYSSGYGLEQEPLIHFSDADLLAAELPDPNADVFPQALADEEEKKVKDEDEEEDDAELDGYETDGDTTEDEEPEFIPIRRKLARRIQLIDSDEEFSDPDSDAEVPLQRQGQPRARRYVLTPKRGKRPVAFIHPHTGKMVIYTPQKAPHQQQEQQQQPQQHLDIMSDPLFDLNPLLLPPQNDVTQSSPLMSNSSSVMMGAMISSNTLGDYMQTHNIGPIEAFFPNLSSDLFVAEDSDFSGEYIEDDGESNLRIEDFIQFDRNTAESGDGNGVVDPADELFDLSVPAPMPGDELFLDLDSGVQDEDDALTPLATPMGPPANRRPSFAASSSIGADDEQEDNVGEDDNAMPPLLAHFGKNSDTVSAFRRNQINQQLIYSNKATADSLAFSGPYTMGTLRGIRNGSLEAVTTPITPPRRPKQRQTLNGFGTEFNVQSPQESPVQKRKASSSMADVANHKRQRSISDLNNIFL
ncbi:hypothetical protein SPBR_02461 [Sporothrix brasiliensis 5110]|uniref:Uncharacterized protein n=1 Tax=Sporothrix brasiliensis 5110 TaxID=1398154 RepID=A0A0C2IUR2_9PEZI|nr:uncharacterized protein SPBR_02461 [Sporothrix brasiliensis 5110]KIH92901.1 hypothetical protein SPBR_02461 [Sporothrix brasiliensis 5110]